MGFRTKHNLPFESASHPIHGNLFRIGTVEGQWGDTSDSYYLLSIINDNPGNGHLDDVFQWFERSCRRDNKNLLVLECFNKDFARHLIKKRGFKKLDDDLDNVIKVFNQDLYKKLLSQGNEIIKPKTLKCI